MVSIKKFKYKDKPNKEITDVIAKLEAKHGIVLMARNDDDIVNGYVTIHGSDVEIGLYEEDEAPNSEHKVTLKKCDVMPDIKESDIDG